MATGTATTITMPQLGESVTEGTIGNWLKRVGEPVGKYEALVEVVTDKVNAEVPSPVAGVLAEILVEPETTVPVGAALCRIEEAGVAVAAGPAAPAPGEATGSGGNGDRGGAGGGGVMPDAPGEVRRRGEIADETELLRVRSSPAVRRIAQEHGVEIARVAGSGIGGRVTKQDLVAHLAAASGEAAAEPAVFPSAPPPVAVSEAAAAVAAEPAAPSVPTPATAPVAAPEPVATPAPVAAPERDAVPTSARTPLPRFPGDEVVPVTPMRRTIAEHMVRSAREAPQATVVMEVDMTRVVAFRAAEQEAFRRREGIGLTFLPFAIKAATLALRAHPRLNAVWDGDRIVHRAAIHVGVAVALEDGLVVPVIRHADRLSVGGLGHAVADLAERARAGGLTPEDVAGGTFTVNNPGSFGSLVSTPILVRPQAAILSTEAIVKRPVVVDEMIAIRSMMNLSLTIDHRILDGLAAARFLGAVKGWLEGAEGTLSL